MNSSEKDELDELELFLDWVDGSLSYDNPAFLDIFHDAQSVPPELLEVMNEGMLSLALASIAHEHELSDSAKDILAFCCASLLNHDESNFSLSISRNGSGRRTDAGRAFIRAVGDFEMATYLKKRAPIDGTESVVANLCARFHYSRSEVFKGVSRAKNWKSLPAAFIYEQIAEGYPDI